MGNFLVLRTICLLRELLISPTHRLRFWEICNCSVLFTIFFSLISKLHFAQAKCMIYHQKSCLDQVFLGLSPKNFFKGLNKTGTWKKRWKASYRDENIFCYRKLRCILALIHHWSAVPKREGAFDSSLLPRNSNQRIISISACVGFRIWT